MPAGMVRPRPSQVDPLGPTVLAEYAAAGWTVGDGTVGTGQTVGPCTSCHRPTIRYGRYGNPLCRTCTSPEGQQTMMELRTAHPEAVLRTATRAAARGWPVFWLGRTKRPVANCPRCRTADNDHDRQACPCLTCHGFYAATTDPDRIAAMHRAVPAGLLAIRTGAVSGLIVVDIDPGHGGRLDPDLMTPTATVATGGGGWHLYYTHPGATVPSRPMPGRAGVDIKADGGYVVAPPSIHPGTGRPYRWIRGGPPVEMPPALHHACRTDPLPAPTPAGPATATTRPTPTGPGGGGISAPAALLAAHLHAVARAPVGRRRTTLYGAARGVARMVAAGAITRADAYAVLAEAGRAAGQTDRDIRAAILGGFAAESVATEGIAA